MFKAWQKFAVIIASFAAILASVLAGSGCFDNLATALFFDAIVLVSVMFSAGVAYAAYKLFSKSKKVKLPNFLWPALALFSFAVGSVAYLNWGACSMGNGQIREELGKDSSSVTHF